MLGVVGVPGDFRDLAGQLGHVKDLGLGAGGGVHNVILGALGRFPAVPELVRVPEPVGGDTGRVHKVLDALGREIHEEVER